MPVSQDEPLLDGNLASIMPDMLKRLDTIGFGHSGTVYKLVFFASHAVRKKGKTEMKNSYLQILFVKK